ncbi:MAG: Thioredoxin reductase [candidate division TM6 bacterium GW2011_GWF2_43_17]|nr:MAG: Thioredoxin reductase [candidate division TM6 bacterium GW2011_GWF2_43_17]HAU30115.1 thioredoxin-disulfide reductase [Candidatus Dependentiae bacterium]
MVGMRSLFVALLLLGGGLFARQLPVVVIGSGPAGASAAMHIADARIPVVLITGDEPGGLITRAKWVENWPGIQPASGYDIMESILAQAKSRGVTFLEDKVIAADLTRYPFLLDFAEAETMEASAVIIATGSCPRKIGIPGEERYWGSGVSGCATCDAFAFEGKEVAVVGSGDSALTSAVHLAEYASHVYVLVRGREMRAQRYVREKLRDYEGKIEILYGREPREILGDGSQVSGIMLFNKDESAFEVLPVSGVFIMIGHGPNTGLFDGQIELSSSGHIIVDPITRETSMHGVFAAGDVVQWAYRQAPVASGSGICAAGKGAIDFVRYQLPTIAPQS